MMVVPRSTVSDRFSTLESTFFTSFSKSDFKSSIAF
jgi:hypothetical protein